MSVTAIDPARRTNARAVAELAALGIVTSADRVLDLTVGPHAGFWPLWRPPALVINDVDLAVAADMHHDARRRLPLEAASFDVVALDMPYAYRGTSALVSDARYGLAGAYRSADEVDADLLAATTEALRLTRRVALVKCQDANVASRFRDQSGFVGEHARQLGAEVVQKLYLHCPRAQPAGKTQRNVWGHPSVLLVLEVG